MDALKLAEVTNALRESEEKLRVATELAHLSCYRWNPRDGSLVWDARLKSLWGLKADAPVNMDVWASAIHPDDREAVLEALARCIDPQGNGDYALEYRVIGIEDSVERWVSTYGRAVFHGGQPVDFIGSVQEITRQKRAEEHQRLLLDELQHRLRNNLTVVTSIMRRTAERSTSAKQLSAQLEGRIAAFARVQSAISRDLFGSVGLRSLIEDEWKAHAVGERLTLDGPEMDLPSRTAEAVSLAIHELFANAVQHGALHTDDGGISVTWTREPRGESDWLILRWEESAPGGRHLAAPDSGFGMELLQRVLPYQLGVVTAVDFRPAGLAVSLSIPLSADPEPEAEPEPQPQPSSRRKSGPMDTVRRKSE